MGNNLETRIREDEYESMVEPEKKKLTQDEIEEIFKDATDDFSVSGSSCHILGDPVADSGEAKGHCETSLPRLIDSCEKFEQVLRIIPSEMRLKRGFEKKLRDVRAYFKSSMKGEIPSFIIELEERLIRALYEVIHSGPPEVQIHSMREVRELLTKYPREKEEEEFSERYRKSSIYFKVRKNKTHSQNELAKIHGIIQGRISDFKAGKEPTLISRLRRYEEEKIIRKWTEVELDRFQYNELLTILRKHQCYNFGEVAVLRKNTLQGAYEVTPTTFHLMNEDVGFEHIESQMFSSIVFTMLQELDKTNSRIVYLDYGNNHSAWHSLPDEMHNKIRDVIENSIKEKTQIAPLADNIRVGIVDCRLYIWNPDKSPNKMINAWSNQFFHFTPSDLSDIILETGKQLQLKCSGYEQLRHLNKLVKQVISNKASDRIRVGDKGSRILGEVLHLICDILGISPRSIEGTIEAVTGRNGRGGITRPKLLEGMELEVLRARLGAIVNSDCWLGRSGRLQYSESDRGRIRIVTKLLQCFGEMSPKLISNDANRSLRMWIPIPMGNAFIYWGFTSGEKPLQNEHLPRLVKESSHESHIAYLEELISEDGCFDHVSGFRWSRTIVLKPGKDNASYNLESDLCQADIAFLMNLKYARWETKRGHIYIPIGKLSEHSKHLTGQDLSITSRILSVVLTNRSRLLDDEVSLATGLGITIEVYPECITIYTKTGRVSLKWIAKTKRKEDAIRWALIALPNDERKRERVRKWLALVAKDVERIQFPFWPE